ncbi:MAG TPA: IS5/IS1182 family transposase, partial [Inquilinus sp.]
MVVIDGGKFMAVNNRGRNGTPAKLKRRIEQIEAGIARYLVGHGRRRPAGGRGGAGEVGAAAGEITVLRAQMQEFRAMEVVVQAAPDQQVSLPDRRRATATVGRG